MNEYTLRDSRIWVRFASAALIAWATMRDKVPNQAKPSSQIAAETADQLMAEYRKRFERAD